MSTYALAQAIFALFIRLGAVEVEAMSWAPVYVKAWTIAGAVAGIFTVIVSTLLKRSAERSSSA